MTHKKVFMTGCLTLALCGCFDSENSLNDRQTDESSGLAGAARGANTLLPANEEILTLRAAPNPNRNAYFGDLHVHTAYSFDAYVFGTVSTPDDAYRYARGQALDHPSGYQVQLQQPLDFYAVTDHAMLMGLVKEAADTSSEFSRYDVAEPLHDINAPNNMNVLSLIARGQAFGTFIPGVLSGLLDGTIDAPMAEAVT